MTNTLKVLSILAVPFFIAGCATTGMNSDTGGGFWYTSTTEGKHANFAVAGKKTGEACASNILGLIATGDASVGAAMRAGGISSVVAIDKSYSNILMIYGKACTIVHGN